MMPTTELSRLRADRKVLRRGPTTLTFETMGTVASVRAPGGLAIATGARLVAEFDRLENRFTMYSSESEAARVSRGELTLEEASAEYRLVHACALDWHRISRGAFTPYPPSGGIDLTGIVKAWAIEAGGSILDDAGIPDWCLNVGGDVLVRGWAAKDRAWRAGIADPDDPTKLTASFEFTHQVRAIATSGYSQRGDHIWRLGGCDPTTGFSQVTVTSGGIVAADVLATAILAGGTSTLLDALIEHPVDVLAIGPGGIRHASGVFVT